MIIISKTRCEKGKVGERASYICMVCVCVCVCTCNYLDSLVEEGGSPFFLGKKKEINK